MPDEENTPSEEIDETVELGADGDATDSAWNALIDQLRERGPGHSRYVFEGELARGGMGVIHRVFDRDARRRLALKVMLGKGAAPASGDTPDVDDASLGRFLEEAQVTSQLDHPGIVPVHEIGVDETDQVYFTMKLVKGEDLRSVFDRVADPNDDEWTTTRALNVMLRVCEAMAYAHSKGVIHRDLKPGNVMVGKFGEAYVMDWGLAKIVGRDDPHDLRLRPVETTSLRTDRAEAVAATPDSPIVTMDGAVVGTPAYMPPEQATGRVEDIGPPADVYAVGAMLYHLQSGRMPYTKPGDRVSPRMILAMVAQGPPTALSGLTPDAPAELVAIVEKAMAREVRDRYPDMTALARDLRAFLENRVVAAYETGAWAELKKWVKRNKALAMTSAAAVVVVAALGTWSNLTIREERNTAEAERDRVKRLSDKRRLDVLASQADTLWPAIPENVDALKDWLARAGVLLEKLPVHEATLAEVRAKGTPIEDPRDETLAILREHVGTHASGAAFGEEEFDDDVALAEHVAELKATIAMLVETLSRERGYEFGDDVDARWWHDAVRDLVVGLVALQEDDVHGATMAGIGRRLTWAEAVAEKTTTGASAKAAWADARAAIKTHPKYDGLDLKPQLGLMPLGPDPESTLWEFRHPQTGDVPARDPDTGKLAIGEKTGLVFVLIPGGTYRIGAQKDDSSAAHFDVHSKRFESPAHDVTLSPFLLSKWEMTQGQWARLSGENPSYYNPRARFVDTIRHPVEQVSWEDCRETLARAGLLVPTEAQWEAACRARSSTPWSTGTNKESLEGFVNLADKAAATAGAAWPSIADWPDLNDGFVAHAPVGSYRANAFGMHDMHGNVCEWCRDEFEAYEGITPSQGDGLRERSNAYYRVNRGGSFSAMATLARSSARDGAAETYKANNIGVRPARSLD